MVRRLAGLFSQRRGLYIFIALAAAGLLVGSSLIVPGTTRGSTANAPPTPIPPPEPTATQVRSFSEPPGLTLKEGTVYSVIIVTSRGLIRADLFATESPETVNNFVFLVRKRFYNNLAINEVLPDLRVELGALHTGR